MGGADCHRFVLIALLVVFLVEVTVIIPVVVAQWEHDVAATRVKLGEVSERFALTLNSTVRIFLYGVVSTSSGLGLIDEWVTSEQLGDALRLDRSPVASLRQAYAWTTLITSTQRPEYERYYGFPIKDRNGTGNLTVSPERPFYWPFSAFHPVTPALRGLFGMDALSTPQSRALIRNEFTAIVMPGTVGIVADVAAKNFGIAFVNRDRFNKGVLVGFVTTLDLLEYTLQLMNVARADIVLAAYAPLQTPQLLYLERSDLLGNATTLAAFDTLPRSNEFFVHNLTVLGDVITVCMRFSDSFNADYAVRTWMIVTAVLVPVAFVILGVVFAILVQRQHRTDIMQLETAKRRESQLMLGYVSHEIRNPLQTILGMSDLCLEEISERDDLEEAASYVETIVRSAEFIGHIANDILDMRRIEEGQIALDIKEVPVRVVMASLQRSVLSFAQPEIEFKMSVADEPLYVHSDRHRLEQILINFLSNAYKYTKEGSVTLSIMRSGEHAVRFAVIDTGRGIPREMLESIFEQFKQVKAGDSSSGFGLGLFLSKRIAILLGGSVGVESSETGSTFWLELPLFDLGAEFDGSLVRLRNLSDVG